MTKPRNSQPAPEPNPNGQLPTPQPAAAPQPQPQPGQGILPPGVRWLDRRQQDRTEEVVEVVERVQQGDHTAIPALRKLIRDVAQLKNWLGGRPDWKFEDQLIGQLSSNPLQQVALECHVDLMRDMLPHWPDDLRYMLLGQRLIATWLRVQVADRQAAELSPGDEHTDYFIAQQERAFRQHQAALEAALKRK